MIVLDDVSDEEQIEKLAGEAGWFGYGSRIIIASRSKRVPAFGGGRVEVLEAGPMELEESLLLYSRHAFGLESPPFDFRDLSEEVIRITGGLPLALEVIGSQLGTNEPRDHGRWNRIIGNLERVPAKKVQDRLKISYDDLDWEAKEVFLDIACFFINKEKTKPIYMWQACGFEPDSTVEELVERSLVKIVDENKFWMHDQLRDLGRKIIRDERFKEHKSSSGIWMDDDACEVLQEEEGKKNIDMLSVETALDKDCSSLTKMELKGFKNLRFLHLHRSNLEGDLTGLLPKLVWLSWHFCPIKFRGTGLSLKNLVVLDLSRSFMNQNWSGWRHIGMCKELKVLDLTDCCLLTRTPDLSMCTKLEVLIFQGCINLVEIDHSVGTLKCLKLLNASGCPHLKEVPEELCPSPSDGPVKLERLSLSSCRKLKKLPNSIGYLVSLAELDISMSGIIELPDTIGDLQGLERINMRGSNIKRLPDTMVKLKRLEMVDALYCRHLIEVPSEIVGLTFLPAKFDSVQSRNKDEKSQFTLWNQGYRGVFKYKEEPWRPEPEDEEYVEVTLDSRDDTVQVRSVFCKSIHVN